MRATARYEAVKTILSLLQNLTYTCLTLLCRIENSAQLQPRYRLLFHPRLTFIISSANAAVCLEADEQQWFIEIMTQLVCVEKSPRLPYDWDVLEWSKYETGTEALEGETELEKVSICMWMRGKCLVAYLPVRSFHSGPNVVSLSWLSELTSAYMKENNLMVNARPTNVCGKILHGRRFRIPMSFYLHLKLADVFSVKF